jgi:chromosome partitioning protein
MSNHVFISYSREDEHQCEVIVNTLNDAGLSVWRDHEGIYAGQIIWDKIELAISRSACFLVIISPNSELRPNVKRELEIAIQARVPIVPVLRNRRMDQLERWWLERIAQLHAIETSSLTSSVKLQIINAVRQHAHRSCKTVAFFNMKGGVGKTMLAAQLGRRIHSLLEKSVLLVDLDPQQNLTEMFLSPQLLEERKSRHLSIVGLFEPQKVGVDDTNFDPLKSACTSGRDHLTDFFFITCYDC